MSFVALRSVTKRYPGGVEAVRSLDLDIEEGEFVVLVGPSGCGKSTTLRMVAGLETITGGDLLIAGKRVNDVRPRDRDIAMVFQTYALYPHMTVGDNMAFGLKLRRFDRDEITRRVSAAAAMLGLQDLLERKPAALSGGQRQRVAMGRAIVREPKVFLFDEPLSNLDARLRVQMRAEIAALHRRLETTMLYVTHDQVEAMTLASRIAVMNEGRLMQYGPPMTLYHEPDNVFVAGFIGSPSMNLVPGTFGEGRFVGEGGWSIPVDGVSGAGTIGIRPEHLAVTTDGEGDVVGVVAHVERMGSATYAHIDEGAPKAVAADGSGGQAEAAAAPETARWVARLDGDARVVPGDVLGLVLDPAAIHRFDAEGRRVSG